MYAFAPTVEVWQSRLFKNAHMKTHTREKLINEELTKKDVPPSVETIAELLWQKGYGFSQTPISKIWKKYRQGVG